MEPIVASMPQAERDALEAKANAAMAALNDKVAAIDQALAGLELARSTLVAKRNLAQTLVDDANGLLADPFFGHGNCPPIDALADALGDVHHEASQELTQALGSLDKLDDAIAEATAKKNALLATHSQLATLLSCLQGAP
jgi:hypothetical protein